MLKLLNAAGEDEIPAATGLVVALACGRMALFAINGRIFAIDDACLRCGASLGTSLQSGGVVRCRGCGWQYDLVAGAVVGLPALRIERFDVRIIRSRIYIAAVEEDTGRLRARRCPPRASGRDWAALRSMRTKT